MWGTVLVLALIGAAEPVRLGMVLFLISEPRPLVNLRACWLGGLITTIVIALGVLVLLRDFALMVLHVVMSIAASPPARYVQVAAGVLALLIAALIVGSSERQRVRAATAGGDPSALMPQPSTPKVFARLSARTQDALGSGIPWAAFLVGLLLSTPPLEYLLALGAILASGAAAGVQISAVALFFIVAFVFFEIPLVSYFASPARTQELMLRFHDWVRAHHRPILAAIIGAAGVSLIVNGIGII